MAPVEPTRIIVVAAFEAGDMANPCARNAMQCLRYRRLAAQPGERVLDVTGHKLWKRGERPAAGAEGLLTPARMQWRFEAASVKG